MKLFGVDPVIAGAGDPARRRRAARAHAGLSDHRADQCAGDLAHLSRGALAAVRPPGGGPLPAGRRSQQRLHRADDVHRLHHQRVLGELHRPRAGNRPPDADPPALLPRDVPGPDVRDEPRARRQQYRPDVGRDRACDAHHGADGRHLSHPRGARSGLEIFHPRQRRHRARAVRHDPHLHGGASGDRRGARRHGVDRAGREGRQLRSGAAQRGVRVPAARLRHQGRPRAAARLAAGRACRRPDADLGGALGPPAQRRALRAAALQAPACRQPRRAHAPAR